jgi:hypothetical protein
MNPLGPDQERESVSHNFYAEYRPTIGERITRMLFPPRNLLPLEEVEEAALLRAGFAPGELMTDTHIGLDWKDRLRVLVSGKLRVRTRTATDVIVNKMQSRSVTYVPAPWEGR